MKHIFCFPAVRFPVMKDMNREGHTGPH